MKIKIKNNLLSYTQNFFVFLTIFAFFFMWDYKILKFNIFYIIAIPVVLIFFKKPITVNKKIFTILSILFLKIIIFSLLPYKLSNFPIDNVLQLVGIFLITIFCIYYKDLIYKNINIAVLIFLLFYLLINFYDLILNINNYHLRDLNFFDVFRCHYKTGFFRTNILFSENSHFGMIAVAVIFSLFYYLSTKSNNVIRILLIIVSLSFFYNSSTTLLIGYILSYFIVLFCCYRNINKIFLLSSTFYLIISLIFIFGSPTCKKRFEDISQVLNTYSDLNLLIPYKEKEIKNLNGSLDVYKKKIDVFNQIYNEYINLLRNYNSIITDRSKLKNKQDIEALKNQLLLLEEKLKEIDLDKYNKISQNWTLNLTTQVYIRSFYILYESLKQKPFGWGFNNYELANNHYKYDVPYINPSTLYFNKKDASNNFVKLLVEFGIFGFILLLYLARISLSNNIEPNLKIFFIPLIITQLIRGAGYFNGGFLIAIFILIIFYVSKRYIFTK